MQSWGMTVMIDDDDETYEVCCIMRRRKGAECKYTYLAQRLYCICDMHAQHNDHVFVGGWTFLCISTTVREVMTITGIHVYCC